MSTYDELKARSGRVPIYVVELTLDRCQLVYGQAPCTASGIDDARCINSYGTCQDRPNYDRGTYILRFASMRAGDEFQPAAGDFNDDFNDDFGPGASPDAAPVFPTLMAVDTTPTRLTPGKGMGWRSVVNITIQDHPYTDSGIDPYIDLRSFQWITRGTFWQRFVERYPFYENARMDILTGYAVIGEQVSTESFQRRTYLLKKVSGPDASGRVVLQAEDPLKLADAANAQWPPQGTASLISDIDDSVTSFDIDDPDGQLAAWVQRSEGEFIRIGDEVMKHVSYAAPTLTVQRALLPPFYSASISAEAHDAGDMIQPCYEYNASRIDAVAFQLLNEATGIDAGFLPIADWIAEADEYFAPYLLSRLLVEPEAVNKYISELTELGVMIWWDERSQNVEFKALKNQPNNVVIPSFDDDQNLLEGSVTPTQDSSGRISQSWLHYGERSPVDPQDKAGFFRQVQISADLPSEGENEYGRAAIGKIFSRWLPAGASAVALEVTSRLVSEYRDTKTIMSVEIDPKDDDVWTGDTIDIKTTFRRDQFGEIPRLRYLVTQVNELIGSEGVKYRYRIQSIGAALDTRVGLIAPDEISTVDEPLETESLEPLETEDGLILEAEDGTLVPFPDYLDASDTLRDTYAFISDDDGFMSNGDPGYVI